MSIVSTAKLPVTTEELEKRFTKIKNFFERYPDKLQDAIPELEKLEDKARLDTPDLYEHGVEFFITHGSHFTSNYILFFKQPVKKFDDVKCVFYWDTDDKSLSVNKIYLNCPGSTETDSSGIFNCFLQHLYQIFDGNGGCLHLQCNPKKFLNKWGLDIEFSYEDVSSSTDLIPMKKLQYQMQFYHQKQAKDFVEECMKKDRDGRIDIDKLMI